MRSRSASKIFEHIEQSLERAVDDFFEELNTVIEQTTPIKTGRARKGWRYVRRYTMGYYGTLIENNVSYIGVLDRGSSRQAPAGIVEPALFKTLSKRPRKL